MRGFLVMCGEGSAEWPEHLEIRPFGTNDVMEWYGFPPVPTVGRSR